MTNSNSSFDRSLYMCSHCCTVVALYSDSLPNGYYKCPACDQKVPFCELFVVNHIGRTDTSKMKFRIKV